VQGLPALDVAPATPRARTKPVGAMVLGVLVLAEVVLAIFGPYIVPHDPEVDTFPALLAPSSGHWFGTDSSGLDVFSRVVVATRLDLTVAVVSVGLAFMIAAPLGAAAGYFRSWPSSVAMRLMDFVQSFPAFILAMALLAVRGPSITNLIAVIAVLNIPIFMRLVRSEALALADKPFVSAARCIGCSDMRIVVRHIMPNSVTSSIAQASTNIGWAIILTAGLSFVGAGVQPPTPEWGAMIAGGAQSMITGQWWLALFPGLALGVTVLVCALAGDMAQELLDVRSRR
jgi:peptide/nickel transport system permease protein